MCSWVSSVIAEFPIFLCSLTSLSRLYLVNEYSGCELRNGNFQVFVQHGKELILGSLKSDFLDCAAKSTSAMQSMRGLQADSVLKLTFRVLAVLACHCVLTKFFGPFLIPAYVFAGTAFFNSLTMANKADHHVCFPAIVVPRFQIFSFQFQRSPFVDSKLPPRLRGPPCRP